MLEDLSDQELLRGADIQAKFRVLYNRYWKVLYKKAFFRLGNDADAQDVVQEIFVSLWRNRKVIEVEDILAPYLFSAVKYQIIKQVHKKARKGIRVPLLVEELENLKISEEDLLQYKELQSVIDKEVNELPARMREIYCLSRNENLQTAEIATRLNISEQTVKNSLSTALRRLRNRISSQSFNLFL